MTKGQITAILDNEIIFTSTEFNGDMYYEDGHGEEIMRTFPNVTSLEEYKEYIKWFNETNHNYKEDTLTYELTDMSDVTNEEYIFTYEEFLDMRKDYSKKWFEDYLYIKNLSSKTVQFIDRDGKVYDLEPMKIAVFNFGYYADEIPNNGLKLNEELTRDLYIKLLEEFEDLRDWEFSIETYANGAGIYISQYSPAGEDFGFSVSAGSLEEVINEICEYAENFDADEHAEMWISCRGTGGVPYSIRDLIDDADAIQNMLDNLAEKVKALKI